MSLDNHPDIDYTTRLNDNIIDLKYLTRIFI